jgi:hypothetical protein
MIKDEAADPVGVALFGAQAIVLASDHVSNLIEKFRIAWGARADKLAAMPQIFPSSSREGKRIMRDFPAIKGGIIPPNSRWADETMRNASTPIRDFHRERRPRPAAVILSCDNHRLVRMFP